MTPELLSQLILATYVLVPLMVVVVSALRCPTGPTVWVLHLINRLYLGFYFRCRFNDCPVPAEGPALIVANHRSPVDPLYLWYAYAAGNPGAPLRPIGFMMAKEYYDVWGFNFLFRALQSIPVDRKGADMGPAREALKYLKEGKLIGIFPEGRINEGEDLLPANPGIAWLALRAQVPVYPAFIHNAPQGESIVDPFFTRAQVRVEFGEPIDLSEYHEGRKTQEVLNKVTHCLMNRLAELGGVEYHHDTNHTEPPQAEVTKT
ncbi:MAG: 1-acyl-sn-glycerol-3-phosphate acyltransferase [Planctomycetaceae bacterium]|nr:1-acyl-sn-glycerol-3-phosphate acyltransferase [Planctomycetaceae bacterium]